MAVVDSNEESNKENMPSPDSRYSREEAENLLYQQQTRREEPDVTVVVRGREYPHYSQVLCLASEYFDAALNFNEYSLREAESKRIEFPDEDPNEWELFASFLEPFSQTKITKFNVVTLIPWFHKLGVTSMLKECDQVYVDMVVPPFQRKCWNFQGHLVSIPDVKDQRKKLCDMLNAYAFSSMYDLTITKARATRALRRIISFSPHFFDLDCITLLVDTLDQEDARKDLWSAVKEYIPQELQLDEPQSLVSNKLFPYLLLTWMQQYADAQEPLENGMYAA